MNQILAVTFGVLATAGRQLFVTAFVTALIVVSLVSGRFIVVSPPASAATIPQKSDRSGPGIESLLVDVNGERRRVDPRDGFSVVRGDLVTIIEARLGDRSKSRPSVDIEGYVGRRGQSNSDDLGRVMDTARDFTARVGSLEIPVKHAVRVMVKGVVLGETTIIIEPPRLLSFDVAVNGERRSVRQGEALSIGPHDGIQVLDVRTNIRGNENVRHDLSTIRGSDGRLKREIRFKRGDVIFAKVPVDWRGS